jgi:Cu2+-exporting ATPase
MHCAGCMGKVERAFGEVDGVVAARANLTARSVDVSHRTGVEAPDLVAALAMAGSRRSRARRSARRPRR